MDKREKLARKNIQNCINFEIGGFENTLSDYSETDKEYIEAKEILSNHDELVNYIYQCAVTDFYVEGGVFTDTRIIAQIILLGREKIMSIVDELVYKVGY